MTFGERRTNPRVEGCRHDGSGIARCWASWRRSWRLRWRVGRAPAWGASGGAHAKPSKLNAARSGPVRTGNGIVQAVRAHAVVVRLLDGRTLVVPVGPRTAVFVNGAPVGARARPARLRRHVHARGQRRGARRWRAPAGGPGRAEARDGAVGLRRRASSSRRPNGGTRHHPRRRAYAGLPERQPGLDRATSPPATGSSRCAATRPASGPRSARASGGPVNIAAWPAASCWSRTRRTSPRSCGPTSSRRATASSAVGTGAEALHTLETRAGAARRARPEPAGHRRARRLQADPDALVGAGRDADRARRGGRPARGARRRRRRLHRQAVLAAGARRADEGRAAPRRARRRRRDCSCSATSSCAAAPARSASPASRSSCGRRSSTCSPT